MNHCTNPNNGHATNCDYTIDGSGNVVPFSNAALYNFAPLNYLQRPDQRYTAGEFSHYQINPHVDVYSSFMFMHDSSVAQIADSGAFYGDHVRHQLHQQPAARTASEQIAFLDEGGDRLTFPRVRWFRSISAAATSKASGASKTSSTSTTGL